MSEPLSLSIFTIEADLKPVLAFAAKKYEEAEVFFRDERVRTKLRSASSGGVPLCDDYTILRIRLANADERAGYREKAEAKSMGNPAAIFLVDVDEGLGSAPG
jgi:hypothetical protein